jgi:CO/xanthine dehydrogenase FAD-binding subunit
VPHTRWANASLNRFPRWKHWPTTAEGSFLRPTSLAEVFPLLEGRPDARLVAGATEIGVEINKRGREGFPCLVSTDAVPELHVLTAKPGGGWRIGAAVPLTAIEDKVAPHYPPLARLIRWFAARQVRNRATLGGNLATASPIGDSAPLLLALDASLVLVSGRGERTVALADFFTGYRRTALQSAEIIREIVLPPFTASAGCVRHADFIKVSHRRELDISIVAAAFVIDVDASGVVRHARLAYGGVADRPSRAVAAEEALVGRTLEASTAAVAAALAGAFKPISDVRSGADYRRGLVLSLWERFRRGERSEVHDGVIDYAPSAAWTSDDASRNLRHESAVGHVTGTARYVEDSALQRPMLVIHLVRSPHAHALITRRDATRARTVSGVTAVLLAEDIPGHDDAGPVRHDEPLLALDQVSFHGQVIALVVGESAAACRAAAALVEVEYEPQVPVVGLRAALAAGYYPLGAAPLATRRLRSGAGLGADDISRVSLNSAGRSIFTSRPKARGPSRVKRARSRLMLPRSIPPRSKRLSRRCSAAARNLVVVQSPRMGGGFGGKETQGNAVAAYVALAAATPVVRCGCNWIATSILR